jgi:hypothetical protein
VYAGRRSGKTGHHHSYLQNDRPFATFAVYAGGLVKSVTDGMHVPRCRSGFGQAFAVFRLALNKPFPKGPIVLEIAATQSRAAACRILVHKQLRYYVKARERTGLSENFH